MCHRKVGGEEADYELKLVVLALDLVFVIELRALAKMLDYQTQTRSTTHWHRDPRNLLQVSIPHISIEGINLLSGQPCLTYLCNHVSLPLDI